MAVKNDGGQPAGGIVVRNTISENLEFGSATVGVPFNLACSRSGTTVTCTIPVLSPGQTVVIKIVTRLPLTATSGHDVSFSASVDPENAIVESNEQNNVAIAIASTLSDFSTAEVRPAVFGTTSREMRRLECPQGTIVKGLHGKSGLWLDAIGLLCADVPLGIVGWTGGSDFDESCGLDHVPLRFSASRSVVNDTFLNRPTIRCIPFPYYGYGWFSITGATAVPGSATREEVSCPDGTVPIGIDVYIMRLPISNQPGISGLGYICARPPTVPM